MLLVLYDGRRHSPTSRGLMTVRMGVERPCLVVVPPGVWHGVKNIASQPSMLLNAVDEAYAYKSPDHWRLPADSAEIPFDFDKTR